MGELDLHLRYTIGSSNFSGLGDSYIFSPCIPPVKIEVPGARVPTAMFIVL